MTPFAPLRASAALPTPYEARWRRFLLLVTPIGIVAFALCFILEVPSHQALRFDLIAYPLGVGFFALLELGFIFLPNHLRTLICSTLVGLSLFFLVRLGYLLSIAGGDVDIPAQLSEGFYWIPLIYLLAMLLPQSPLSRYVQIFFTVAFSAIALLFTWVGVSLGRWEIVYVVTQVSLANLAIFLLLRGYASYKDDLLSTQAQLRLTEHYAYTDSVTGLPNRHCLEAYLTASVAEARAQGSHFILLFIDLDNFKLVNDVLGHVKGDHVLRETGERLQRVLGQAQFLARHSGDEFVAVLGDQPKDAIEATVKRLCDALYVPFLIGGQEALITASVGISCYPQDGESAGELLSGADAAMYRVKHSGKNGAAFYNTAVDDHSEQRKIEKELRYALQRRELSLVAQPIFDLHTAELVRVEILTRWRRSDGGFVSPDAFIPAAERSGYIVPLGHWVLRQACLAAAAWSAQFPELKLSVNVSQVQLAHPDFVRMVQEVLAETGLRPGVLALEMTESILAADLTQTYATLALLRELGVKLMLDDFGKGYSSLSCLKDFPFDVIKLDKSFVADLQGEQAYSRAVLGSVAQIAKHLGLSLVAEGIECETQRRICKELGYRFGQGYYLAKPLPLEAVPTFAGQRQSGSLEPRPLV